MSDYVCVCVCVYVSVCVCVCVCSIRTSTLLTLTKLGHTTTAYGRFPDQGGKLMAPGDWVTTPRYTY